MYSYIYEMKTTIFILSLPLEYFKAESVSVYASTSYLLDSTLNIGEGAKLILTIQRLNLYSGTLLIFFKV